MQVASKEKRSLDKIIEKQVKRWQIDQKKKYKKRMRPVITLSRLPGAGANSIAERLAEKLEIDLFDGGIVEKIVKALRRAKGSLNRLMSMTAQFSTTGYGLSARITCGPTNTCNI